MNLNRTKEECDWFIRVKNLDSYQLENELFGRMMMIRISFLPLPSHVVHVLFGGNKLEDRVERHLRERRQIIRQTLCIPRQPRSTINDSRSGHITRIPIPRCEHASFVPYKRQKPPTKSFHTRFISLPSWLLPSPLLSPFKFQIFDTWLKKREREILGVDFLLSNYSHGWIEYRNGDAAGNDRILETMEGKKEICVTVIGSFRDAG